MLHRAENTLPSLRARSFKPILIALATVLVCAGTMYADTWHAGDLVTYEQNDWGTATSAAGQLLTAHYFNVYAATSGALQVGLQPPSGFGLIFEDPGSVLDFLPATGLPGALDATYLDPITTPAGDFGGDVVALALNIDFTDAAWLGGASSTRFGDLILTNLTTLPLLNGMTVREFLAMDNELLGGGSGIYSIDAVSGLTASLNGAFENGNPSVFAEVNLIASSAPPSNVPEPSSVVLLGSGSAVLAARKRTRRSRSLRFRCDPN